MSSQITQLPIKSERNNYDKKDYNIYQKDKNVYLCPKNHHKFTLVWMHGLGDTAFGFLDFFNNQSSPVTKETKVILLQAPENPVTINGGMQMPSWYDIKKLNISELKDNTNLNDYYSLSEIGENSKKISEILDQETEELKNSKKVFIGGFSQGCAMALHVGLSHSDPLAGIFGLSGYLFPSTPIKQEIPVFIYHGKWDSMIDYKRAQQSYERIKHFQQFQFLLEDGLEHSLSQQEIQEFKIQFEKLTQDQQQSKL